MMNLKMSCNKENGKENGKEDDKDSQGMWVWQRESAGARSK